MTWEIAYLALNASVVPAWALLLLLPRAGLTKATVHSGLYPIALGFIYIASACAAIFFGQASPQGHLTSLGGVTALFSHPNGIILGWTHYLVFDLFVGAWIARDAFRLGLPHLTIIPALLLVFLFGPVGLLCYLLVRLVLGKGLGMTENAAR
ncbi:MAG: DUF4281 domain-containing protein [Hyphomonadaceae bacterium]|nr:DUF4281 domain-containing protein [Hyphomonadaceae bacterium]